MEPNVPGSQLVEVGEEWEVDHGEADVSQHGGAQSLVEAEYSLEEKTNGPGQDDYSAVHWKPRHYIYLGSQEIFGNAESRNLWQVRSGLKQNVGPICTWQVSLSGPT